MGRFIFATLAVLLAALPAASGLVLGIDFGATYFKVALVKPGKAFTIIHNTASKRKTSTMVAFGDENERLYAGDAENLLTRRPKQTFQQIRNMLGRNMTHPMVKKVSEELVPHLKLVADEFRNTIRIENPLADAEKIGRPETFSVEELIAMIFSYAKSIGETEAEGKISDIVITVPAFFTQFERQALIDAAAIVNLNVLSMIDENTAAAVQYGIDRVFENTTHKMLIYNFGANSLQVSLNYYTSRNLKRLGTNTTVSQFEVVSKAFIEGIGGRFQDKLVADYAADGFNEVVTKNGKNEGYDVRDKLRPWAKLCKKARKVKEILSANEMFLVFVESVDMDKDLKGLRITREQFEEMCAPMFDVAMDPVQRVLDDAGITADEVDQVEIIGGSVRAPKLQEMLQKFMNVTHLGVHLNGDESMALGAAFHAANRSKNFRVRHVGMQDVTPFSIGVRLSEKTAADRALGKAASNETDEEEEADPEPEPEPELDEDGNPKKPWSKRATLFKRLNRLYSRKLVSFSHTKDFMCTMRYDQSKDNKLPEGTPRDITVYDVSGVEDLMKEEKYADFGKPKINLSFLLDHMGFVGLVKAEAVFEKVLEEEPEEAAEEESDDDEDADAEEKKEGDDADAEEKEGDDADAEKDDADADADAEEKKEGDDADAEEKKEGDDGDEEEEKPKKEKKKKKKPKKKTHKVPLTFKAVRHPSVQIQPMTDEQLEASRKLIKSLDDADEERRMREQVMNELESAIYAARDLIRDEDHGAFEVTTEEFREQMMEKLTEAEDWIYDAGADAPLKEARDKRSEVQKMAESIKVNIGEKIARPAAAEAFRAALEATEVQLEGWTEDLKPQIKQSEKDEVKELVEAATAWINEKEAEQLKLELSDEPAFTSSEVAKQLKKLQKVVKKLLQKPKPRKVTLHPPKPPAQICSESAFNSDEKCAAADENLPRYDTSRAFKDCMTTRCTNIECCKKAKKKKKKKKKAEKEESEEAEAEAEAPEGEGGEGEAAADDGEKAESGEEAAKEEAGEGAEKKEEEKTEL